MNEHFPKLTPRLATIAKKARQNKGVCDIGTDHGFLPVYLVLKGICPHAYACDINEGPLEKAKGTIAKYSCEDKITPILSNGFENMKPCNVQDVIIAGMGGELIAAIIEKAPFLKEEDHFLLLQPMTSIKELRQYLYENGFNITDEEVANEQEKFYVILSVKAGKMAPYNEIDLIFGKKLFERNGPLERLYLEKLIKKFETAIKGLKIGNQHAKQKENEKILNELVKLLEAMKNDKR